MTVVVDLGCADWGAQDSIEALTREYEPECVYGFDPHPRLEEMRQRYTTPTVHLERKAAWLWDGEVGYVEDVTRSHLVNDGGTRIPCFDFSAWLANRNERVTVKMDIEGAEYDLLERMIADGTDRLVDELLIEWHRDDDRGLPDRLHCPTRDWWM